jgi:hypothetical protein
MEYTIERRGSWDSLGNQPDLETARREALHRHPLGDFRIYSEWVSGQGMELLHTELPIAPLKRPNSSPPRGEPTPTGIRRNRKRGLRFSQREG